MHIQSSRSQHAKIKSSFFFLFFFFRLSPFSLPVLFETANRNKYLNIHLSGLSTNFISLKFGMKFYSYAGARVLCTDGIYTGIDATLFCTCPISCGLERETTSCRVLRRKRWNGNFENAVLGCWKKTSLFIRHGNRDAAERTGDMFNTALRRMLLMRGNSPFARQPRYFRMRTRQNAIIYSLSASAQLHHPINRIPTSNTNY